MEPGVLWLVVRLLQQLRPHYVDRTMIGDRRVSRDFKGSLSWPKRGNVPAVVRGPEAKHGHIGFFSCLTDNRRTSAPPDALPALRLTPLVRAWGGEF
jgi:hypothetical protein